MFTAELDAIGDEFVVVVWEHFADKEREVQGIYSGDMKYIGEQIEELYGITVEIPTVH